MKKALIMFALILALCGCGAKPAEAEGFTVMTTIFPPYDMAREIAKDKALVKQLLPAGAESHTFEPSPQDIIAIQNSDLFIYTGGESDVWIEDILASMGEKAPETLKLTDCVQMLSAETVEGMENDHHHEHDEDCHHEEYDEHVWTSPKNAIEISKAICEKMAQLDSSNSESYNANLKSYIAELEKLDGELSSVMENAKRNLIVVGDRFPFRYLTEHYNIEYFAAFPACGNQGDAAAATVAFLTDKVKENQIPAVLYIEFSNHKVADAIAESAGVKTALLHSCHNVSKEELEGGASYITLMKNNIETLKMVLN